MAKQRMVIGDVTVVLSKSRDGKYYARALETDERCEARESHNRIREMNTSLYKQPCKAGTHLEREAAAKLAACDQRARAAEEEALRRVTDGA